MSIAVVGLMLSGVVLVSCAPDWKSSLATWELDGEEYRLRLTGGFGTECVVVEHEVRNSDAGPWLGQGIDCEWIRVTGGDGWLAAGDQVRAGDGSLLFGIVPASAAEIVVSLAGRAPLRLPTMAAGEGGNRVYAAYVRGEVDVTGLALRDAGGKALHVY